VGVMGGWGGGCVFRLVGEGGMALTCYDDDEDDEDDEDLASDAWGRAVGEAGWW